MSRTFVDIEAVKEVLADVKDCEDKQYALALLEWAIEKRTVSEEEIRTHERARVIAEVSTELDKYHKDICNANYPFNFVNVALNNVRNRRAEK